MDSKLETAVLKAIKKWNAICYDVFDEHCQKEAVRRCSLCQHVKDKFGRLNCLECPLPFKCVYPTSSWSKIMQLTERGKCRSYLLPELCEDMLEQLCVLLPDHPYVKKDKEDA